jgi:hypothetical protein
MSRIINIPHGKEIKPRLGAYLLKGGMSHEIPVTWVLPETYTDGSPIDFNFSEEPATTKISNPKRAAEELKPKKTKRSSKRSAKTVKNTTTESPKDELPKEEDNDV